jgi:hypothetical protein
VFELEAYNLKQEPPSQPESLVDGKGAVQLRVVDEALRGTSAAANMQLCVLTFPANGGTRLSTQTKINGSLN